MKPEFETIGTGTGLYLLHFLSRLDIKSNDSLDLRSHQEIP